MEVPATPAPVTPGPITPAPIGAKISIPSEVHKQRYAQIFQVLHTQRELAGVSRDKCYSVLVKSGLPEAELQHIWRLSDVDADGMLNREEFILAMHLTNARVKAGIALPEALSPELRPNAR